MISACGLVFLKMGASRDLKISISEGIFEIKLNIYVIIGLLCYVSSFIVSLVAMGKTNLNIFYPISAGLGYIVVCVASYLILKESFSVLQIIGTIIILIGVIIMNL
jgi:multidrug transporter EmrE-like cation transporter